MTSHISLVLFVFRSRRDALGCLATELLGTEDAGRSHQVVTAATTAVKKYARSEQGRRLRLPQIDGDQCTMMLTSILYDFRSNKHT